MNFKFHSLVEWLSRPSGCQSQNGKKHVAATVVTTGGFYNYANLLGFLIFSGHLSQACMLCVKVL